MPVLPYSLLLMDAVIVRTVCFKPRMPISADLVEALENGFDKVTENLDKPLVFGMTASEDRLATMPSTLHSAVCDVAALLPKFRWSSIVVLKKGHTNQDLDIEDWVRPVAMVSFEHDKSEPDKNIVLHDSETLNSFDFKIPDRKFTIIWFTYKHAFQQNPFGPVRSQVPMWSSVDLLMVYCIHNNLALDGTNGILELKEHSVKYKRYYLDVEIHSSDDEQDEQPKDKRRIAGPGTPTGDKAGEDSQQFPEAAQTLLNSPDAEDSACLP